MKIFDCFMFSDENMILDIRLNVLSKYVDHFVIVESKYKHNGDVKSKKFDINNFSKFKNKIKYIYLDKEPSGLINIKNNEKENEQLLFNTYLRENYQRNMIRDGLFDSSDNDFIIIGDVDEIPNLDNLDLNKKKNHLMLFKQKMFYYKLNLFYKELVWIGSRACIKKKLKTPQWLRNIKSKKYNNIEFINDGGWHFTNMKSPDEIFSKLSSFLHNVDFKESGLSLNDIKKMVSEKKILYDHFADQRKTDKWDSPVTLKPVEISLLPDYIAQNTEKFKNWLE